MNLWLNTAYFAQGAQASDEDVFYSFASPCPSTSGNKTIPGNFRSPTNQSCEQLFLPYKARSSSLCGRVLSSMNSWVSVMATRVDRDLISGAHHTFLMLQNSLCVGGYFMWYFPGMRETWLFHEEYWCLVALTLVRVNPAGMKRFRYQHSLEEKRREEG